jgi:4-amino-4-deoxy-L-arabinose transferase-like glycosyltransferase
MKIETKDRFWQKNLHFTDYAVPASLALAKLLVHLATNLFGGYGIFRDELYYIACSKHLAWGYVDQPPFSIALLWLNRRLFGDSLFALRLLPALAGAAAVFLAGWLAKKLGGGRFAQVLAAASVLVAPLLLGTNSVFSMNSFDVLFWTLTFCLTSTILEKDDSRYWLLLGIVLGLGLLNKISVLWLGAGLAVGLLLTAQRKLLLTKKAWLAAGIILLIFLPHVIWQSLNHFPTLEFIRNASAEKYSATSPPEVVRGTDHEYGSADFFLLVPGTALFPDRQVGKTVPYLPDHLSYGLCHPCH